MTAAHGAPQDAAGRALHKLLADPPRLVIDQRSGVPGFWAEREILRLVPEMRWAAPPDLMTWGFVTWRGGKPARRHLVPIAEARKPVPPGGYAEFG